jgi:hypothetical protein
MMADAPHVSADTLEGKIRARGPVLDMSFVQAIYKPLLEKQPRDGVIVARDVVYGPDARHRLDVYRPQADSAASRWSGDNATAHGADIGRGSPNNQRI